MKEKVLIIVGGNSKLISKLLELDLNNIFKKIIIISHRKFDGGENYEIIQFLEPKLLKKILEEIILNKSYHYYLVVSNTPPQNADFNNKRTLEWSNATQTIINMDSFNEKISKVIFTGSCLPLLPFYNESFYKELKKKELITFVNSNLINNKKFSYIILPPLKFKKDIKINLLFDDYEKWALIIKQELNLNNSIIFPMGIVGFITKILFLIKFKTL